MFSFERAGAPCAVGFFGKAQKPTFNYRFRSPERREAYILEQRQACARALSARQERRDARTNFEHSLKVDDVLYATWGYDQTNVNFYQVTDVRGADVMVRPIAAAAEETGFMSGRCHALPGKFTGPAVRKRVQLGDVVRISTCQLARLDEPGKSHYWSSYG